MDVDEGVGWMGAAEAATEVELAEPEAGFGAGLGSGQAVIGLFGGRSGTDRGFEVGVVATVAGSGHAW